MSKNTIEIKKAWLVTEWAQVIKEGEGFHFKYIDSYEKDAAFFRESKSDNFRAAKRIEVLFSFDEALQALKAATENKKKWYERQVNEYTDKLKKLL